VTRDDLKKVFTELNSAFFAYFSYNLVSTFFPQFYHCPWNLLYKHSEISQNEQQWTWFWFVQIRCFTAYFSVSIYVINSLLLYCKQ